MDWLKLEDINQSLYFVAVNHRSRAGKRRGERQPRYLKFFQGTLLFVGLLLLLWVPLLVFSSGNPTYQVPAVVQFSVNATLLGRPRPGATAAGSARSFPLFAVGQRRLSTLWDGAAGALGPGMADYEPGQFQLLCTAPVREEKGGDKRGHAIRRAGMTRPQPPLRTGRSRRAGQQRGPRQPRRFASM